MIERRLILKKIVATVSIRQLTISVSFLLFTFLILLIGIKSLPTTDRDEAHFAQATRQMLQTGNYFQIRFQDETRFQKPPGINWLQALSVSLFSHSSDAPIWIYRIPSVFCSGLSIFCFFYFSRRYFGNKIAVFASLLLTSSLLFVVEEHLAVIDSALLFSAILMQGALFIIYMDSPKSHKIPIFWSICFWLSMILGFLLKGVTPLIGFLTLGMLLIVDRWHGNNGSPWLKELRIFWGLGLFIGLTLLWVVPVNREEQSNYLLQMFYHDLLPKLKGGHESHGKPPLFHLAILLLTFWPGSVFLFHAIRYAWSSRYQRRIIFLLAWMIPTWIFFEIMPTKLPQYVLPTFPVIALFTALSINEYEGQSAQNSAFKTYPHIWFIVTSFMMIACVVFSYLLLNSIDWLALGLITLILIISAYLVYFLRRGLCRKAFFVSMLLSLLSYFTIFTIIIPKLQPMWITKSITQKTPRKDLSTHFPLLVVGYNEPSLVFELDTSLVKYTDRQNAYDKGIKHKNQLLLFSNKEWDILPKEQRQKFIILEQFSGFNYNTGRWIKLLLLRNKNR